MSDRPSPPFRVSKTTECPPISRATYLATLDACAKAVALETEKAAANDPAAMARWAAVAVPRYRALMAVLDQAECEDWGRATVWWAEWKDMQATKGGLPHG